MSFYRGAADSLNPRHNRLILAILAYSVKTARLSALSTRLISVVLATVIMLSKVTISLAAAEDHPFIEQARKLCQIPEEAPGFGLTERCRGAYGRHCVKLRIERT